MSGRPVGRSAGFHSTLCEHLSHGPCAIRCWKSHHKSHEKFHMATEKSYRMRLSTWAVRGSTALPPMGGKPPKESPAGESTSPTYILCIGLQSGVYHHGCVHACSDTGVPAIHVNSCFPTIFKLGVLFIGGNSNTPRSFPHPHATDQEG